MITLEVLVTGGAGFIGSNLVRSLTASGHSVRILDNLTTGTMANLKDAGADTRVIIGDIRNPSFVEEAVAGVEAVYHLAALPSVARSIRDPIACNAVNSTGTLNVLVAARDHGVRRVVYASSSSVYGDSVSLPKHEDMVTAPRSPYAASKLAGESMCRAFTRSFGLETVALRFFNVFGPRQDPKSEYAAVIPKFIKALLKGKAPEVHGDGTQTRDFTYVGNVVQACLLAESAPSEATGEVFNVGCAERYSLLELLRAIGDLVGCYVEPTFTEPRTGDVKHSLASIEKAAQLLGYVPVADLHQGLEQTVAWFAAGAAEPTITKELAGRHVA
ncbi:MAG: SDR family oxidoreductase [Actinomycetota bacterium]